MNFSTANGTAIAGIDYTAASGTLTWADGDTTPKAITVPLLNPAVIAADKTLTATLSAPLCGSLGATTGNTLTVTEPPWQSWQMRCHRATTP